MSELFQDLHFGLRTLFKSPGFALVALLTLGIGIGANAAIFSYVDGVLLRPSPYADVKRMVRLMEKPPGGGLNSLSTLNYLDLEKQNTVFEYITAQSWGSVSLTGMENPLQTYSERVSLHFFDVFKMRPALGRLFAEGEDQVGRDHVAVISHSFWMTQFGGERSTLGRSIILDSEPYTIIGILPPGTFDTTGTKIWRPLAFAPENMTRDFHWFNAWGLLKPGVSLEQARSQMDVLAASLAHDYPKSNKGWGIAVDPFSEVLVSPQLKLMLNVLMGAVGMVLLIACANLANLTLTRGISREREIAVRAAVGAGRGRLIRQFLTESLVLSVGGGALGLAIAYGGMVALKAAMPQGTLPPNVHVALDGRVLLFTLGISVLTGVLFGIVPAAKATRPDLVNSLKQGALGSSAGRSSQGIRQALVITEVALAFILLTGAGLLIRSFFKLERIETGFDSTNVLTAHLPISPKRFSTPDELTLYLRQIAERVGAIPGVRSVALSSALPMQGWGYGKRFHIIGTKVVEESNRPGCFFKMVSASYFGTIGLHLTQGRLLSEQDVNGATPVAVINQTMVKRYFPNENPLGKQISVKQMAFLTNKADTDITWEVVGVVADEKVTNLTTDNYYSPGMYVPNEQSPQGRQALLVRTATEPSALQTSLRQTIKALDPDQVLQDFQTLDQIKAESVGADRFRSLLMGIFAATALILAVIGLYGVISYSVAQRTREIGIRTALGANPGQIFALIIKGGMTQTFLGLGLGLIGALGLARFLASMLYDLQQYDPVTLIAVGGTLASMALLACCVPARRAMRVKTIVALRNE